MSHFSKVRQLGSVLPVRRTLPTASPVWTWTAFCYSICALAPFAQGLKLLRSLWRRVRRAESHTTRIRLPARRAAQGAVRQHPVPVSQIHAVASFYPHFHLSPPPKVDVRVCADMSCHLRGGDQVKSALDSAFQGADSKEVSIRDVSCLGRCDQAPAIMVNDNIYAHVNSRGRSHHGARCARGQTAPAESP